MKADIAVAVRAIDREIEAIVASKSMLREDKVVAFHALWKRLGNVERVAFQELIFLRLAGLSLPLQLVPGE
jgi:hypothetical protein